MVKPRITYPGLCVQAALEMLPPGSLAARMILSLHHEAKKVFELLTIATICNSNSESPSFPKIPRPQSCPFRRQARPALRPNRRGPMAPAKIVLLSSELRAYAPSREPVISARPARSTDGGHKHSPEPDSGDSDPDRAVAQYCRQ